MKKEADVDRSQSITTQTRRKLDVLIFAVLVVAVGMLLADKFLLQEMPQPSAGESDTVSAPAVVGTEDKSVAVLPFVAMSNGPDDEYFADGLTEEILNSLAQLPELLVTARTSAFSFKGLDVPIPEVATKLGVAHVVEGSVRRAGERLRITAQLIRAHDGFHLWSETYDRSNEDSFGVQGEIAEKIAAALNIVLDENELGEMYSSGLRNPEAFVAYQKGLELFGRAHGLPDEEEISMMAAANVYFDRVIELEPEFATGYFIHSDYYTHYVTNSVSRKNLSDADIAAALQSAEQDLQLATSKSTNDNERLSISLERALLFEQWRRIPELMSAAYQSSGCLNPSWWGGIPSIMAPSDDALAMWRREVACDPLNWYSATNFGQTQLALGDFAGAIATAKHGMEVSPHVQIADLLFRAYVATGNFEEASAANLRFVETDQGRHYNRLVLAAATGDAALLQSQRDAFIASYGSEAVSLDIVAASGDRQRANELAAEFDAKIFGFLNLMVVIENCDCGAPFDLEVTPNFARLVDEAGFSWPPPSPINWPLKDW